MNVVVTLWWLFFWTAIGLCVGSFLNVVIYRLPRDKSLRVPLWSACPACDHRIRWFDNLPIVSFILLGGHCRDCDARISPRYLFIEAATAMVLLLLLDALFIGQVREGLSQSQFGLTDRLSYDWPILVSHFILFAALLAMSAIDMEHYWVDIRFTNFATACGFLLHAIWTPEHSTKWFRPSDTTAVMSLLAIGGLFVVWLWLICRTPTPPVQSEPLPDNSSTEQDSKCEESPCTEAGADPPRSQAISLGLSWAAVMLLLLLFGTLFMANMGWRALRYPLRTTLPLLLFFLVVVRESTVTRESDREIMEAIDDERHLARRMVLHEFMLFIPAILLAVAGYWLMQDGSGLRERIADALHGTFRVWDVGMFRRWAPLEGLSTAAAGYVLAGALGWSVRIIFTLVFGREAFATGDIHMMAAAGAVAGWPVVLLGFFVTCGLALAGWVLTLPFKQVRALPLGPWLFLSLLAVTLFYEPLVNSQLISHALVVIDMLVTGNSQLYPGL